MVAGRAPDRRRGAGADDVVTGQASGVGSAASGLASGTMSAAAGLPSPKKRLRVASVAKSRIVPVRFAPADYEKLEIVSAENSVSVSELVRQSVLRGSGVYQGDGEPPRGLLGSDERLLFGALLEEVRRVGVNINQIAMRMNAGRVSGAEEISQDLRELRALLGGLTLELRQLSSEPLSTVRGADA